MNLEWAWLIPIGVGGYIIWSTVIKAFAKSQNQVQEVEK